MSASSCERGPDEGPPDPGVLRRAPLGDLPRPRPCARRRRETRQLRARIVLVGSIVVCFLLGLWAPIGRRSRTKTAPRPNSRTPAATGRVARICADRRQQLSVTANVEGTAPVRRRRPRRRAPATEEPPSVDLTARRLHAGMRRWTSTTHPKKPPGATSAARGSKRTRRPSPTPIPTPTTAACSSPAARDYLERAAAWQALKFDAGFARITWEPEFGGRNGTTMQQMIFGQEEGHFDVPNAVYVIGLGMIAPTLRAVRHRRAAAALPHQAAPRRRDLEPAVQRAGRRLRRRVALDDRGARRRRVGASTARRCGRRARSTPTSARSSAAPTPTPRSTRASPRSSSTCAHPGVTIKPLKQMNGGASFNEVFFDDVRVPHENVLGGVNEGWTVAITTLMNERVAIGSGGGGGGRGVGARPHRARAGARCERRPAHAPAARRPLHEVAASRSSLRCARSPPRLKGQMPGPEGSIGKLFGGQMMTEMGELAIDIVGVGAVAGDDGDYRWHQALLGAPAAHIAGGSDEVMKNIIGERVLGLPGRAPRRQGRPLERSAAVTRPRPRAHARISGALTPVSHVRRLTSSLDSPWPGLGPSIAAVPTFTGSPRGPTGLSSVAVAACRSRYRACASGSRPGRRAHRHRRRSRAPPARP